MNGQNIVSQSIFATIALILLSLSAQGQSQNAENLSPFPQSPDPQTKLLAPNFRVADFSLESSPGESSETVSKEVATVGVGDDASSANSSSSQQEGLIKRSVIRIGGDQKRIYLAPFKRHNWKWDAIVLVGTGAFLAADKRIEAQVPNSHLQTYQDISNIAIGGLAASLGGIWLYGVKTEHQHARETGELELETLVNAFLVYTPMQFIFGRQRPGAGNGRGDFFQNHMINTSFPSGHAMFTWAMASTLADEYPKPWARVLSYGAAFTVTFARFMAHDHWSSDMFLGTALGLGIAENTFHSHCDPQFESQCKGHQRWWKVMKMEVQ